MIWAFVGWAAAAVLALAFNYSAHRKGKEYDNHNDKLDK